MSTQGKYLCSLRKFDRKFLKYIFLRQVGGFMNDSKWDHEAKALDELISAQGLQVDTDEFYVNAYNGPMEFFNRRNEVWN